MASLQRQKGAESNLAKKIAKAAEEYAAVRLIFFVLCLYSSPFTVKNISPKHQTVAKQSKHKVIRRSSLLVAALRIIF